MAVGNVQSRLGLIILLLGLSACATPNVFENLKETGYIMSPNFSSAYEPGTLIQTARIDRNGKESTFKTPVVITLAADCFPGKAPQQKDLVLPRSRGQRSVSLDFGASALSSMATSLSMNMGVVKNYSLTFEKPQVIYYPISDIFGQLSPKCVRSLDAMQQTGNKIEWFEIIYEVVVAHSLSFKLEWNAGASAEARLAQANEIQQQVEGWMAQPSYQPASDPYGTTGSQQQYAPGYQAQPAAPYDPYGSQQQYPQTNQAPPGYQTRSADPYGQYSSPTPYAPEAQQPYQATADPSGQYAPQQQRRRPRPDVHFKVGALTSSTTELRADGVVIIAYRSAALRPIKQ